MATISDSLLSINATKNKLKNNLYNSGVDSSAENNFSNLVDMAFIDDFDSADTPFIIDPAWLAVQDLRTWTESGAIGMIMSDHGYAKMDFSVATNDNAPYTVIVNDGTTNISTVSYASGEQASVSVPAGDGTVFYAIKITSSGAINNFAIKRTAGIPATTQTVPLLWWFGNLTTLTNCAFMFYSSDGLVRACMLQKVDIVDTSLVTNMAYMFSYCTSLRSIPAVMDTHLVTNMAYMFSYCTSLRSIPAVMDTSLVTNMTYMFGVCYSLRSIPAVMDTHLVTNMSYMFFGCYSLRSIPAVMDTSLVTNMAYMFSGCYSLRSIPAVMDTHLVTNMAAMFNSCYSLRSIPAVMDTSLVTNMTYMFGVCYSLRSIPAVMDVTKVTDMTDFGMNTRCLERTLLDLSVANQLTKLKITESDALKGLLVSSSAPWSGTSPQIDITNCGLDATAINALFTSLGIVSGKSIKIAGNPGTSTCTLSIATNKGWTVVTV